MPTQQEIEEYREREIVAALAAMMEEGFDIGGRAHGCPAAIGDCQKTESFRESRLADAKAVMIMEKIKERMAEFLKGSPRDN